MGASGVRNALVVTPEERVKIHKYPVAGRRGREGAMTPIVMGLFFSEIETRSFVVKFAHTDGKA